MSQPVTEETRRTGRTRWTRWTRWTPWRQRLVAVVVLATLPLLGVAAPTAAAALPAITSVSPTVGVPGTAVRITGTGFATAAAGNTVTFGSVRATVTAASATALTVTAPAPRVSSKVRVRTASGTSGSRDFYMPPAPYTPAQVGSRVRTAIGGASVRVTNATATHLSLVLFDAQAGQRFAVDMTSSSIQNPQLRLYRPGGTIVRSVSNYPEPDVFLDTVVAPVTGTYSVAIDGRTAGAATVTIRSVPADSTGTLTRGVAQTVTTTAAGQNALRSFSGTAGQRVALQFSDLALTGDFGTARLLFVHPDGSKLGTERSLSTRGAQEGLVTTVTLPVSGTYRVKFDPEFKAVGSVRLLLHAVPADSTGAVTVGTPFTVSTTVGQSAFRSFAGTAGQRVLIDATSVGYPRGVDVDVLRPDGTVVRQGGFFPPSGYLDDIPLDVTGTYRIRVDAVQASTGSMTMVLRSVPPDSTGTLTVGTPQTVTTTASGQNAVRTFRATPGDRLALTVSDATYLARVVVDEPQTQIELVDGFTVSPGDEPRWTDVFRVPPTGTVQVRVDGSQAEFGSVRLLLQRVPPDDTGTLTPGVTSRIVTTASGQNASRTFTAQAGQRVGVQLTNSTLGGRLELFSPSGLQLLDREAEFFHQEGPQGLQVSVEETGTYTLRINPPGEGAGQVDALLYVAPPDDVGTIAIGGPPQTLTLGAGQDALRTFTGVAGQRVVVRVTGNTFPYETAVFVDWDGFTAGRLLSEPTGELPVDLNVTGTYRLTIRPSFAATGSATVQVVPAP